MKTGTDKKWLKPVNNNLIYYIAQKETKCVCNINVEFIIFAKPSP